MSKFWIIALDVYKKNVKSISFLILLLIPVIMGGVFYLVGNFAESTSDVSEIGIVSEQSQLAEELAKQKSNSYQFKVVASAKKAQQQLKEEVLDAYLVIDASGEAIKGSLYSETSIGQTTELQLQQILTGLQSTNRAAALGLTPEQVASLSQPANFTKQKVSFTDDGKMSTGEDHSGIQAAVSYGVSIILFVFILTYAQIIAQEIASEKGTRIMEIILSSTKAQTHFYGKLVGVLLVALTQLVLYAAIFGLSYNYIKDLDIVKQFIGNLDIGKLFGSFLVFTIVFALLGILIYSVLAALCGSLVNKAEDTAKAILPVTYLSMIGYFISMMMGMMDPNNMIIRIGSYIPFLSSYFMPVRLASDTVGIGGALISVVILVVSTLILMMLSAKMYKSNVLIYNEKGVFAALKESISVMQNNRAKAE